MPYPRLLPSRHGAHIRTPPTFVSPVIRIFLKHQPNSGIFFVRHW